MLWPAGLLALAAAATSAAAPSSPGTPSSPVAASPAGNGDMVRYVVKPNDTLYRLARAFIVDQRTWMALLPLAGVRDPHRLPIGRTLVIPRDWLRANTEDASLVSFRGDVTIRAGGRTVTPSEGLAIHEGTRIVTGADGFATLTSPIVRASRSPRRATWCSRTCAASCSPAPSNIRWRWTRGGSRPR